MAEFNPQFNLFAIDNIDFENFPPVENKYGTATGRHALVLLYSK
jgi:GGDEF domain-containing protein